MSPARVALVQPKRKSRLLISLGFSNLVGERKGGEKLPALEGENTTRRISKRIPWPVGRSEYW